MTIEDFIKKATTGNHANDPNYVMCCKDAYELAQEIQGLLAEVERLKSLAASRLADQEAIERHTRKQIYRELYEIRYEPDKLLCKIERECSPYIRQKYGVE